MDATERQETQSDSFFAREVVEPVGGTEGLMMAPEQDQLIATDEEEELAAVERDSQPHQEPEEASAPAEMVAEVQQGQEQEEGTPVETGEREESADLLMVRYMSYLVLRL